MPKAMVLGGKTGMLGQALVRELNARGWETSTLGREDGDVLDPDFLREKINAANADVYFNAIAWTAVDDAEDFPEEAGVVNRALPDALSRIIGREEKGSLVHFSTDFVFSGAQTGSWKETDKPRPEGVYAKTKLAGENAVLENLPERSLVIRTAWLFGSGKKNFVATILNACAQKDAIRVVDDNYGSPTYAPDLANWSVSLAEKGATGLWHGVNSGRASWCELALEAAALANSPCKVEPISFDQWPQKAKRPINSVLNNDKLANFLGRKPRPWPRALRDYIFGKNLIFHPPLGKAGN